MHSLPVAADQIVPWRQRVAIGAQDIGAGSGQPRIIVDGAPRQPDAIGHMQPPVPVIGAAAAVQVKQFARDIGGIDSARIFILHLV